MNNFILILFILFIQFSNAQIISKFTWDSDPVTNADVGPNGTTVSSSAYSSPGGVGGTNGLNPRRTGSPKQDIDLDIPASPTFDVPGIDISIDFRRNESVGDFVTRGNDLVFGMNGGNLHVSFKLDDGNGGYININSGNVYNIPTDNTFRTYRFYYLPTTGEAKLLVDGSTVWTYNGTPGLNLYWTHSTLRIGNNMDGTGTDEAIFDNLIIAQIISEPLPVELVNFDALVNGNQIDLKWVTATEINNDYFVVEKSKDGKIWEEVVWTDGAGNSNHIIDYYEKDLNPYEGISYYRLKQVDFDGKYSYSNIVPVAYEKNVSKEITVLPNPVKKGETLYLEIKGFKDSDVLLILRDVKGNEFYSKAQVIESNYQLKAIQLDNNLPIGTYLIIASSIDKLVTKKIIIE
jgi:hypothetical protein